MQNKHSSDGAAEDLVRGIVQLICVELHTKTILEKLTSQMENGLIDIFDEKTMHEHYGKIESVKAQIHDTAELRRSMMLYLYNDYGKNGDKEQWCTVKHSAAAMMCAFEVYQANDDDPEAENYAYKANALFIRSLSQFLGYEITECAACFADMIKGES